MNVKSSGIGADMYFGSPEEIQPDWRVSDPDDEIDDNDDPAPIAPEVLAEMLGFDLDEED